MLSGGRWVVSVWARGEIVVVEEEKQRKVTVGVVRYGGLMGKEGGVCVGRGKGVEGRRPRD